MDECEDVISQYEHNHGGIDVSKHGEECSEHDGLSQHDQIDREEQEHRKQKLPGQQSIKSYFRVEKAQKQGDDCGMEDRHRRGMAATWRTDQPLKLVT